MSEENAPKVVFIFTERLSAYTGLVPSMYIHPGCQANKEKLACGGPDQ